MRRIDVGRTPGDLEHAPPVSERTRQATQRGLRRPPPAVFVRADEWSPGLPTLLAVAQQDAVVAHDPDVRGGRAGHGLERRAAPPPPDPAWCHAPS